MYEDFTEAYRIVIAYIHRKGDRHYLANTCIFLEQW